MATFQKQSIPALRADIQFTVVEAMLKGYLKWKGSLGSNPQQDVSNGLFRFQVELSTWRVLIPEKIGTTASGIRERT